MSVVLLGVANRVSNKAALVVLKDYLLVLIQVQTIAYLVVYFGILFFRIRKGAVTKRMLEYPKWKFMAIGALDALGNAIAFPAAAAIPGAMLPVLSQSTIPFSLLLSSVFLRKKYQAHQILGCFLALAGVLLSLKPYLASSMSSATMTQSELLWKSATYSFSYAFPAIAVVLKEITLQNKAKFGEKGLDVFVINSFSSLSQALVSSVMLLLVATGGGKHLFGSGLTSPTGYIQGGIRCFAGDPWPPIVYIGCNILFNVQVLNLIKRSNAVIYALSIALVVPLSFMAFSFPIPRLEQCAFHMESIWGLAILSLGIFLYFTMRTPKFPEATAAGSVAH
eukprot:CAMPEP_0198244838 /NCGR_PEP_ID=MMETSP1446-20131203/37727_1 /TAXON_ID=1461542 ORGANISM="Unidentified sp, Strain CCMP2111" /NCGR_SAMPLE_ID=MMETSP1446 /ASSEMBLY_ACC=CAM_ASM_001112 /LENGTH=335 /DNA_ID=CAMNT_0043928939 /DNA_START=181 /DNA_END=1188 /DNA_ORIENTATION=-